MSFALVVLIAVLLGVAAFFVFDLALDVWDAWRDWCIRRSRGDRP